MPLLTDIQRDRLINREEKKTTELEAYKKRHNDQVVLDKLEDFIDSIPDALLILKHLPQEKISKKLRFEQIPAILDLVEELIQRIDPWPVAEQLIEPKNHFAFKTMGIHGPNDHIGACRIFTLSRPATPEEIAIHQKLTAHCTNLQHYIDPYLIDPICRSVEDLPSFEEAVNKKISASTYTSRPTANGLREVMKLDMSTLKFKRWNPKGLPRKYDVPEQEDLPE